MTFFTEPEKKKSYISHGRKKDPECQSNPEQRSNIGGIILPTFKIYYRDMVTKAAWYLHKNRQVEKWSGLTETNDYSCH